MVFVTSPKMEQLWIIQNLVLFLFLILTCAKSKSYEGYKVYEITPETYEQVDLLYSATNDVRFDFLRESQFFGDHSDIMVAPNDQWNFEKELNQNGLKYNIVVEDVQRMLQEEKMEYSFRRSAQLGDVTFKNYMFYEEQMAYLKQLAQNHPNFVTVENIGHSYEGREILLLKISSGASQTQTPKPVIFVDAGIHSREWIAPPVALYIIQQLVKNSSNAYLYENVDWAIVPNLNPDGYVYTQKEDRLWRKNRRLIEGNTCYGTDLNRNFGHFWMYAGASNNSCSQVYAGSEKFSEPESRALRDWFVRDGQNVKLYLTFHSFGEMILYPWGYDKEVLPNNAVEHQTLGERVAQTIDKASSIGSNYSAMVNSSALALSAAAGGSDDWVKGEAGVELSYTIELPNRDAPYVFMLPARHILPVVQETFEGVKVFQNYIEEKFVINATTNRNS